MLKISKLKKNNLILIYNILSFNKLKIEYKLKTNKIKVE